MKNQLIIINCKRCGKPITATRHSLLGLNGLKAKYGRICAKCMPQEEQYQMVSEMGQAIVKGE